MDDVERGVVGKNRMNQRIYRGMQYLCRETLGMVAVSWFGGESLPVGSDRYALAEKYCLLIVRCFVVSGKFFMLFCLY